MVNSKIFLIALAKELRKERDKLGKSQQQASSESRVHVGRAEMGFHDINITTLLKLCIYYQISLCELLTRIEAEIGSQYGAYIKEGCKKSNNVINIP